SLGQSTPERVVGAAGPVESEHRGVDGSRRARSQQATRSARRWVFVNKDGDAEGHFLRKFKAIAKRAGLNCGNCKTTIKQGKYHLRKPTEVTCATSPVCEKHHLHRLRKTCATRWLRNGVNLMDIMTWLGHKSLETTEPYLSYTKHIGSEMQANIANACTY